MSRADRLAVAQRKIDAILNDPDYKRLQEQLDRAQTELRAAERSYDIGEQVSGEHSVGTGCDTEWESFSGVIEAVEGSMYRIRQADGSTLKVYDFDIARPTSEFYKSRR